MAIFGITPIYLTTMNNALLVPTDFSSNAKLALEYAMRLAERFNWSIHLFHTYFPVRNALAGADFIDELQEANLLRKQENMALIEEEFKQRFPTVTLTTACIEGDLTKVTLALIEETPYRLLVMGTKGAGKIKGATIGSNTFDLIQHSSIGVLAIPETEHSFKLENLGILTNFKESEFALFRGFINRLNVPMNLILLHAFETKDLPAEADVDFWKSKFEHTLLNEVNYSQEEVVRRLDYNSPVPRCIERMVKREDVDILLVSYNHKSFFKQLFSKNLTKSIALNPNVPTYFMRDR